MALSAAERSKRYRDNLKKHPSKHRAYLRQEKARYVERKAKGEFDINGKTPREQRRTRRRWRFNKKKERDEKIKQFKISNPLNLLIRSPNNDTKKQKGRRKTKANRAAVYRELETVRQKLKDKQRSIDKYRKRFDRLKSKINGKSRKPNKTKRKEKIDKYSVLVKMIIQNIKRRLSESQTERDRHSLARMVQLDFLKRYRGLTKYLSFITGISTHRLKVASIKKDYVKRSRTETWKVDIIRKIQEFLELDINSTQAPGKNDTITRKCLKKQKRYLSDTLRNLHLKFNDTRQATCKVSYQTFCRYKPFWIVEKKLGDRDTCLCKLHENVKFMVNKLYNMKILKTNDTEKICGMVTCDLRRQTCMLRQCSRCKDAKFDLNEFDDYGVGVEYFSWVTKTDIYEKDGTMHKTQKVCKQLMQSTAEHLLNDTLDIVKNKFCTHVFNIRQQFCSVKSLKDNLRDNEMLLHVDFSENFACKSSDEIQSMHFGGSRQQASLHTSVLYGSENTKSFCSISDGMDHNPPAIWSHLKPILIYIKELHTDVDTIHFVSDGPTTQYRSKNNFFLYHHLIHKVYGFKNSSWNFTEAGHGKGAADGIGAVVKRTADRLVNQGVDIPDPKTLYEKVKALNLDISVFFIDKQDFAAINKLYPSHLEGVKNTMKLHQLVSYDTEKGINTRSLSCFCSWPGICSCFEFSNNSYHEFPEIIINDTATASSDNVQDESALGPGFNATEDLVVGESNSSRNTVIEPDPQLINQWCIIKYDDKGFPGVIQDLYSDSAEVKCMCRIGQNRFFWPLVDDCIWYEWDKILRIIPEPLMVTRRHWQVEPTIWREVVKVHDLNE